MTNRNDPFYNGNKDGETAGMEEIRTEPMYGSEEEIPPADAADGFVQAGPAAEAQQPAHNKRYSALAYENAMGYNSGNESGNVGQRIAAAKKDENVILGIIGALVGTFLGLIVWCIIGMAGYIAWIGGLALALGAFYGYTIGSGSFSGSGLVIVAVILILSVYVGNRMVYAMSLRDAFDEWGTETCEIVSEYYDIDLNASTGEIFKNMSDYIDFCDLLVEENIIEYDGTMSGDYYSDTLYSYIVTFAASLFIFLKKKG